MAWPTPSFGSLTTLPLADLDQNFAQLVQMVTIPCLATGINAITLTGFTSTQPTPASYTHGLGFFFKTTAVSTAAVTVNFSGLGAVALLLPDGTQVTTQLGSGINYEIRYDSTAGAFVLQNFWPSGTAGQVLISNSGGAPSFGVGSSGAGAFTFIAKTTAASVATLADTTSLTSTYPMYLVTFYNVQPVTDSVTLNATIHSAGAWQATNYSSLAHLTAGAAVSVVNSTTAIPMSIAAAVNNTVTGAAGGYMWIHNPSSATQNNLITGLAFYNRGPGTSHVAWFSSTYNVAAAIDGIRLSFSSGNITAGTMSIYGLSGS